MINRRRRRGCFGTSILILLGMALGLVFGVILPESGRRLVANFLPHWFVDGPLLSPPPSAGSPSPGGLLPTSPTPTIPAALSAPTPAALMTPTPAETNHSLPESLVIPPKSRDVARLYNGLRVRTTFEARPGQPASIERETPDSYALDLQLQVRVPTPMKTLAELSRRSPTLGTCLPKLSILLEKAEVSKFYNAVYQNKTDLLRQNLIRLDALLARDVFFDTDTVLEMADPDSHRRALLIQTDMDVDTDGSDPERWNEVDASDPTFQPLTNYRWLKRNPAVISPLVAVYRDRIDKLEVDARALGGRRPNAVNVAALETLRDQLYGVEHYSSLIARNDPYVVLPSFMTKGGATNGFTPQIGDFVVVIAGNVLYPAIFGDKGPNHQLGEASLRIAQAINPRATAERSPVDDLKITYVVFPGTAEQPFGPPDLGHIRQRCQDLLNEIGGNGGELHEWTSLLPPPPATPTPTPNPTPTPTPTASATVSPLAPPAASVSPALSSPAASVAPEASATPSASPSPSVIPAATSMPTPTPTPTPTAKPHAGKPTHH